MFYRQAIKKSFSLKSIPQEYYEGMELLNKNKGATSFVFDKGDGNVRIFSNDTMKKEWLTHNWGLNIGEWVDTIEDPREKLDIYVIDMPKLEPLDSANKRKVNSVMTAIKKQFGIEGYNQDRWVADVYSYFLDKTDEGEGGTEIERIFYQFFEFIINYSSKQYGIDFGARQFLQTPDGQAVLVDPVVQPEVVEVLRRNRKVVTW
jgi:hypothetical protein